MAKILLAIALGLVVVVVLGGGCIFNGYNQVVQIDEKANQAWSEVDNQLKRRAELIPELVETVKGAAGQEQTVFLGIANARKAYFQAQTVDEKVAAGREMDSALSRLLVLSENYPELKSNESFLKLQDELAGSTNRPTVARQRYNSAVQELNSYIRQFPGRIYATIAGVKERPYIEAPEKDREAPKVDFSDLREKK